VSKSYEEQMDARYRDLAKAVSSTKLSNPKDMVGSRKVPLSTLPFRVLWRVGLAMLEGALKYGRHNYRAVGVRASVYFDGAQRHLGAWWEGQDVDPDSGLNHIDKAIAGLIVLRDSMLRGNWEDDRPPASADDWAELNREAARITDRYAVMKDPKHYTIKDGFNEAREQADLRGKQEADDGRLRREDAQSIPGRDGGRVVQRGEGRPVGGVEMASDYAQEERKYRP